MALRGRAKWPGAKEGPGETDMSKIVSLAFAACVTMAVGVMIAASDWGADNLPHQIHITAWHIVALR